MNSRLSPVDSDWQDGFVFVGNQLSLDFLNTQPVIDGEPLELLPDLAALLRWLTAAQLMNKAEASMLTQTWRAKRETALASLHDFREALRHVVFDLEHGHGPSRSFVSETNRLLTQYTLVDEVAGTGMDWKRRRRFDFHEPGGAFAPILDATVELLVNADYSRIRKCGSCVLHFYDTSKKGTRRWCSMQMCGNRSKVAAYALRQRSQNESATKY